MEWWGEHVLEPADLPSGEPEEARDEGEGDDERGKARKKNGLLAEEDGSCPQKLGTPGEQQAHVLREEVVDDGNVGGEARQQCAGVSDVEEGRGSRQQGPEQGRVDGPRGGQTGRGERQRAEEGEQNGNKEKQSEAPEPSMPRETVWIGGPRGQPEVDPVTRSLHGRETRKRALRESSGRI